jgi:acyl-CoA thioester hydrolase
MKEVLRVRVAFAHTDAMGVAWHGNYLLWFEQARTELMRDTPLPYREFVAAGFHLPVIEACVRYRRPARYDDLLVVRCRPGAPRGVRLRIDYRIECGGVLVAEGHTDHAFTNAAGKPVRPSREVLEVVARLAADHDAPRADPGPGGP